MYRGIFPGGSDGKASPYNAGDLGSIPGSGRSPGEGNGNPPQYSYLENPMGGGTWLVYSPWGCKESDTTERLHSLIANLTSVIVSGGQQRDPAIHIHVLILPQIPILSRLPRNTEQRSLCYTAVPCSYPFQR